MKKFARDSNKPNSDFFSALPCVGAITTFLSMNWFYTVPLENSYSLLISIAYALIFFGAGSYYFWQTKKLKIPGGALSPLGILLVPLIFYSLQLKLHSEESKPPEYLKYVDEIIKDFSKDMEKKYQLHCYGDGGSMPNDVAEIGVFFISYQKSTVENARKMEVNAIQELVRRINDHEKIRPYLREYPFNQNRVDVSISFRTETDNRPLDGSVALVFLAKNKIFYKTAEMKMSEPVPLTRINKNNEWTKELIPGKLQEELVPLLEETYEEALKIVQTTPPTEVTMNSIKDNMTKPSK